MTDKPANQPLSPARIDSGASRDMTAGFFSNSLLAEQLDNALGWGLSLAIHAVIVLFLVYFSWPGRPAAESAGTEVGLVVGTETGEEVAGGLSESQSIDVPPPDLSDTLTGMNLPMTDLAVDELEPAAPDTVTLNELSLDDILGRETGEVGMDEQAGLILGSGGGAGGTASFFGLEAKGKRFIYVVDYSGSMTGLKLRRAKQEISRSLYTLGENMEFFIIFYNHSYLTMPGENLVKATHINKQRYVAWLMEVEGGGRTDPTGAMMKALSMEPDAVWLLSDGKFNPEACEVIRRANQYRKVRINTIAYHDDVGEAQLRLLARQNYGQYRFVPSPLGHRNRR